MSVKISPSLLSADFARLGAEVASITAAGADLLHIDVMDGKFVPNITLGPCVIKAIRKCTHLPLDVHLMIENPSFYIKDFAESGADIITIHAEAEIHLYRTLQQIKYLNKKAGISLIPSTAITTIKYLLPLVDLVLIMTVNPGFGGQPFIVEQLQKIYELKDYITKNNLNILISADGGIDNTNALQLIEAGVDILVAGTAVFKNKNYAQNIQNLRYPLTF